MSCKYAEIISCVSAANNIKTLLVKNFVPTPALSITIRKLGLCAGIMVTASHNPPQFNGIKFKTNHGCSADSEITKKIESYIGKNKIKILDVEEAKERSLIKIIDILPNYRRNIRKFLNWPTLKKSKIKVLIDNMHGASDGIIVDILKNTGIKTTILHANPRADFGDIPPEPIERNLTELIGTIKRGGFDIGLAFDGDGDRLAAISTNGQFISSSQIFGLLASHFLSFKKQNGILAKTISCSSLIDKIAEYHNVDLIETPIGFKHLAALMMKENIMIAGEESGGIGVKNYLPDRDGILAGLLLIEMLAETKCKITELLSKMEKSFGKFYYQRKDIEFPQNKKSALMSRLKTEPPRSILNKEVIKVKSLDGIKFTLEDGSWLMYRLSGTEPVLRIYAESNSKNQTLKIVSVASKFVRQFS